MADDEDVLEWPVDTAEFMHFDITAPVDPLADPVFVALVPRGKDRTPDDFLAAEWEPGQAWVNGDTPVTLRRFYAANELDRVLYKAAVRITDDPEAPVMKAKSVRGVL